MERDLTYEYEEKEACSIRSFLKRKGFPKSVLGHLMYTPGGTRLNGQEAKLTQMLQGKGVLQIHLDEEESSSHVIPVEIPLDVLYEDEDILVVNKPAFLPMHSSQNHYQKTLANAVAWHLKEKGEEGVFRCLNRLDRDTTGVTVIARNRLSAAVLGEAGRNRQIHREYLAIVEGITEETGQIDVPIGRVPGSVILRQPDPEHGENAHTEYRRLKTFRKQGKDYSLLSVCLGTGRTHQIRVHMKYIGHPLPGDFLYNPDNTIIGRQTLHSFRMTFHHPVTKEEMTFEAPLPQDMIEFLDGDTAE